MGEWEVKKYRPQNRLWLLLERNNVGITFEAVRELVWIFSLSGKEWAALKAGVNNSLDSSWSGGEKERLEACWRPWRSAWGTWWGKVIKVAGGVCKKGTVREGSIAGPLLGHTWCNARGSLWGSSYATLLYKRQVGSFLIWLFTSFVFLFFTFEIKFLQGKHLSLSCQNLAVAFIHFGDFVFGGTGACVEWPTSPLVY